MVLRARGRRRDQLGDQVGALPGSLEAEQGGPPERAHRAGPELVVTRGAQIVDDHLEPDHLRREHGGEIGWDVEQFDEGPRSTPAAVIVQERMASDDELFRHIFSDPEHAAEPAGCLEVRQMIEPPGMQETTAH